MLSGIDICDPNVVTNRADSSFRAASYDVRVGKFIAPRGATVESYALPAQGIIDVISCERVCIPHDLAGFAMVKTSLCNEGILALNIGVLDPGWDGPISSFLVNFGK